MTRLILIHGTAVTVFNGLQADMTWDTQDTEYPVDAEYFNEVAAIAFDAQWQQAMADCGRQFKTKHLDEIYF
jgi:hypothetical protein